MTKTRLNVDWHKDIGVEDLKPALRRFKKHLEDKGLRASTIEMYVFRVGKYLEFAKTDIPSVDDFAKFSDILNERRLSRSTVNNYLFAIKKYHELIGGPQIEFTFIKPDNHIPYHFDEDDIARIFYVCSNIKHLAMLMTLFYAGLRANELCELDDSDLDLKSLILRVRGKGGKEAMCYLNNEAAQSIKRYLEARPLVKMDGRQPLFITDFGNRWNRRGIWRMFSYYKRLAKIEKHGGVHTFSRHSFGTLLIKNGCDIVTVKELMRHSDVHTTMRYLHVADTIKREKYEKYLIL